jgi:hypothetical protein
MNGKKMKKNHTIPHCRNRTVPKCSRKIVETETKWRSLAYIYMTVLKHTYTWPFSSIHIHDRSFMPKKAPKPPLVLKWSCNYNYFVSRRVIAVTGQSCCVKTKLLYHRQPIIVFITSIFVISILVCFIV